MGRLLFVRTFYAFPTGVAGTALAVDEKKLGVKLNIYISITPLMFISYNEIKTEGGKI